VRVTAYSCEHWTIASSESVSSVCLQSSYSMRCNKYKSQVDSHLCGVSDGRQWQHATRAAELCHQAYEFLQQNKKTHKNVSTILQDCAIARIGLQNCLIVRHRNCRKKVQMRPFQLAKMKKNRAISRLIFWKFFWGHSPQTPILGRGYSAPSQTQPPSALRRFAPSRLARDRRLGSGPSVPPSSGVPPAPNLPLHHWP